VAIGTMLQDEAFHFYRMGTFLERADNTARLIDVKFHAVESDFYGAASEQDQELDFYHWSAILRSVSAFEVYRKVYRAVITPERVAELMILRPDMPRSLLACMNEVVTALREHRVMEINYRKLADNSEAWRSIQPMFLRWYASQWYLFARNLPLVKDDSPRAFRMDCIQEVKFGGRFKPKREDAPDFFAHRFIGVSGHDTNAVEVVLHMDQHALRWLRSTVDFDHFGVSLKALGTPTGWWEVRWTIDPNAEFIELLSRIQADFKVIDPESFKMAYRERLEVLLKRIS
jgi:predicted DNA-binding transcriptional regulator YafY